MLASGCFLLTLRAAAPGRQETARPHPALAAPRELPHMSYVDAVLAPQRKTGQIKLPGPAAFDGMRRAGRLAAECLDMLSGEVRPGVSTERIDRLGFDFALSPKGMAPPLSDRGSPKPP